jgi:hypothetical protein
MKWVAARSSHNDSVISSVGNDFEHVRVVRVVAVSRHRARHRCGGRGALWVARAVEVLSSASARLQVQMRGVPRVRYST